jgi:hypothetical protein
MGKTAYNSQLFKFAFFPSYDKAIAFLAHDLADKEDWDFRDSESKNNGILKIYLEFTFRKLLQEKKVAFTAGNNFACFNTGLVTENLEDIFAFFEEYRGPRTGHTSPFCFKAFLKKSDNNILKHFSHSLPDIRDDLSRFPPHLQTADDPELRRQLAGAIDEVKKKVRTNYKIAVPQYYNNRIQLLLPLCLTSGSPNADLALVIHKLNDLTYTARTCLTLKMAYNNARLIVKPQSNWLKP